jgi:hypothetical protein
MGAFCQQLSTCRQAALRRGAGRGRGWGGWGARLQRGVGPGRHARPAAAFATARLAPPAQPRGGGGRAAMAAALPGPRPAAAAGGPGPGPGTGERGGGVIRTRFGFGPSGRYGPCNDQWALRLPAGRPAGWGLPSMVGRVALRCGAATRPKQAPPPHTTRRLGYFLLAKLIKEPLVPGPWPAGAGTASQGLHRQGRPAASAQRGLRVRVGPRTYLYLPP